MTYKVPTREESTRPQRERVERPVRVTIALTHAEAEMWRSFAKGMRDTLSGAVRDAVKLADGQGAHRPREDGYIWTKIR